MIPVATTVQMRECDRITIEKVGLPSLVLMENAARAVAAKAVEMMGEDGPAGKRVRVFCGRGNNGGDGLAAARYLVSWGVDVELFVLSARWELKGDAGKQAILFQKVGGKIRWVTRHDRLYYNQMPVDLIIDALLGTGFTGRMKGLYETAVQLIERQECLVLAVDIPSGVNGDTGAVEGTAVRADATVTFGLYKPGLLLPPGRDYAGKVQVVDIGIPTKVVEAQRIRLFIAEEEDIAQALPYRSPSAHKGEVGHVYILAGSPGLTGAAALAADAAMRTGVGLAVVGVPKSLNPILEMKLTEAMSQPLPETETGGLAAEAFKDIKTRLKWADAVVFGPGVGKDEGTAALLEKLLSVVDKPLVIDADGLNLLAEKRGLLRKLPPQTVLTPHPGEFARLTDLPMKEVLTNRVELARQYSRKWQATLHLKGAPSLTALPDGKVYINPTGNTGMATGGSGDVLTGVIATLLAQGLPLDRATVVGAFVHGAAGDMAAEEKGEVGMVAGDIIRHLPGVLKELTI